MSFILDALQKSETDRRRAASPALAGMATGPERQAVPAWIWAVIVLLVVTVLGLAAAWWSSTRSSDGSGGTAAIADERPAPSGSALVAGQAVAPTASGPAQSDRREDSAAQPPPDVTAEESGAALGAAASESRQTLPGSDVRVSPVATETQEASTSPAQAAPAAPAPARSRTALPTLSELGATGAEIPDINLELHVYHPSRTSRWVYINGGRYTEGQVTQDGIRLLEIVPEGVVLNHAGRDFLLLAQ